MLGYRLRALGITALVAVAGCSESAPAAPDPASQDEEQALQDAAEILEERRDTEPVTADTEQN